jgi:hypothetical protein
MHAVLSILEQRARVLCDHNSLHDELEFLRGIFRLNAYSDKPDSVSFQPYVRSIFNCISRVLFWHNIK